MTSTTTYTAFMCDGCAEVGERPCVELAVMQLRQEVAGTNPQARAMSHVVTLDLCGECSKSVGLHVYLPPPVNVNVTYAKRKTLWGWITGRSKK